MNLDYIIQNKIGKLFRSYPFFLTFILSLSLLLFRCSDRIINLHLWAEDGSLFLPDAFLFNWKSIFLPYAGYYHALPRFLAYIIHLLPVAIFPIAIFSVCTILYALTVSMFVLDDFSKLVADIKLRFLIVILLCMVPGLNEVLGNLANLHSVLFLFLCLSVLSNKQKAVNIFEFFLYLICAFSAGEAIVLLPFLIYKFLIEYKANSKASSRYLVLFLIIISSAILNLFQSDRQPQGQYLSFDKILLGWQYTLNNSLIFQPIIGDKLLIKFYRKAWSIYFILGILIFLTLIFRFLISKKLEHRSYGIFLLCISFIPLLIFIVRPNAITVYANVQIVWLFRYAFILAPWGLISYFLLLDGLKSKKLRYTLVILLFLCTFIFNRYRFFILRYGDEIWSQASIPLQKALSSSCPERVIIPIYPDGSDGLNVRFYFDLTLPKPNHCISPVD